MELPSLRDYLFDKVPTYSVSGAAGFGLWIMRSPKDFWLAFGSLIGVIAFMTALMSLIWLVSRLCIEHGGEVGRQLAGFDAVRRKRLQLK